MKKNNDKCIRYIMFGVSIMFFVFWYFFDGIRVAVDTESYVSFTMSREPVYPTLLALFRWLVGQNYFEWVGLFQSLFWAFAIWYLCDVLYREMGVGKLSYVILLVLNFTACLTVRFLAARKALYSLDMASEGIAVPLYILFVTELFLFGLKQKNTNLIKVILLGVILISTRKQMYIVLPVMGVAFVVLWVFRKIKIGKFVCLCILTVITLLGAVLIDKGYNYVVRGEAVRHSADSSALLINAIFVATEEDAANIENEEVRQLFLEIINTKKANNWGYEVSPGGLSALSEHYANNFDNIAFEIVNPAFYDFLTEQGIEEYVEKELAFGKLNDYMFSSIAKDNIAKILHVFIVNAVTGFCNTIAKDVTILFPVIVGVYGCFAAFCIYLGIKKKWIPEVWFGILVAASVVINVVCVSIMIFSQSRYMIYNMPLFYCAFYLLFYRMQDVFKGFTVWRKR